MIHPAKNSDKDRAFRLSRRRAFRLAGGLSASAILSLERVRSAVSQEEAPIEIPETGAVLPSGEETLRWIDSGEQKELFWEQYFAAYQEAHPNITVLYDGLPFTEIAKVVPLGIQNGNAHDVFNLPPNVPPALAVREGWVSPIDDIIPNFAGWKAAFPPGVFLEGVTDFNGRTYAFPLTSNRRYSTLTLYNADYMADAGYDPASQPLTWEQFREAARKITEQGRGQYYGLIIEGSQVGRWEAIVGNLAHMAGAPGTALPGTGNVDWRTGEFNFTTDAYLAVIELLLALNADGSIFPGSLSLNAPQARAQMPQGAAGMILQGPWNIVNWQRDNPDFAFGVASQPVPDSGKPIPLSHGPGGSNTLWVYAESPRTRKAIAGDMFAYLGSVEGQAAWASVVGVADPPHFPEALEVTNLDPLSRQALDLFDQQIRLAPDPRVRNPDVTEILLEFQPITPSFGEVVQGLFTGQLTDPRAAMRDLQDRNERELERATEAARAKGAEVSRDDFVFPNWDPTRNYTEADYAELG